jgi:hypothetical protein
MRSSPLRGLSDLLFKTASLPKTWMRDRIMARQNLMLVVKCLPL